MIIMSYSFDETGLAEVSQITRNELPSVYLRPDGWHIKSLKVYSCNPKTIIDAFSIVPMKKEVGAIVNIDWSKAIRIIDKDDYEVELRITGDYITEPLARSFCLKINKIGDPEAIFKPNANLIWGRDQQCGTIVITPQVKLIGKDWAYSFGKNEIKIPKKGCFFIKNAEEKDGYWVCTKNPWETAEIPVYCDFEDQRIGTAKTFAFQWSINGFDSSEQIVYRPSNKKPNVEFSPQTNLIWGRNEKCGTLSIKPTETTRNRLLHAYDKTVLSIKKSQGFYIKENGTVEKGDDIVLELDPWETKDIVVYYRFPEPKYSISKPKEVVFECTLNSDYCANSVIFNPWEDSNLVGSFVMKVKKKEIFISPEEQLVAEIFFQKESDYQPNPTGFSVKSNNETIIRCDSQNTECKCRIWLKEGAYKDVPSQPVQVVLTASAANHTTKTFTLTFSANQSEDENHIQLLARDGLELKVDIPPVVYVPTEKVEIPYTVYNHTEDKVLIRSIDSPEGKALPINPGGCRKLIRIIENPDNKTEYVIEVKADYLKPVSQSFEIRGGARKDLTVLSTFKPIDSLFIDTEYNREYCGVLELEIDKSGEEVFNPLAYNDTKITLEVLQEASGMFSFELEKSSIMMSPNDDIRNVKVFISCERLAEESVLFKYMNCGLDQKSYLHLKHKDYAIFGVWFKSIENNKEIPLDSKDPIKIGSFLIEKSWEKDGETKHNALQWNREKGNYEIETIKDSCNEDAFNETVELPNGFSFENNGKCIELDENSDGKEFSVYFSAYQYFNNSEQGIESSINLEWSRKWSNPEFCDEFYASEDNNPRFVDLCPSVEVMNGMGKLCQFGDDDVYQIHMDYTQEQFKNRQEEGLIVCRLKIHNPSLLSPVSKDDIIIEFDDGLGDKEMPLLSLNPTNYSIQPESSCEINVIMSWDGWQERQCPLNFEFAISIINNQKTKFRLDLDENRYNNVYCIDLGTKGVVACKMTDFLCDPVELKEDHRDTRLETDRVLLSSVVIIPENKHEIIFSPQSPEYYKSDFVFCPTKFMVGQSKIPFMSEYVERQKTIQNKGNETNEDNNTLSFSLVQPDVANDDNEQKKYYLWKTDNPEHDLLTPKEFVQDVYQNIFHRLPNGGNDINSLVLTYPNTYTPERLNELEGMIEDRFPNLKGYITFVPESDAVVAYYLDRCLNNPDKDRFQHMQEGENRIVIYDMGAGTLDLSYVVITKQGEKVNAVVERRMGIPIAGDYLDYVLRSCLTLAEGQRETSSVYSQKEAIGKIKPYIHPKKGSSNGYSIERKDGNANTQDMFVETIDKETKVKIDEYLDTVVKQVFDTILFDDESKKELEVDRVVLSGRASLFPPIKSMIIEKFPESKVELLHDDSVLMKTCVAQGALVFNSMFVNNENYKIRTKNRYHKIGIVYFAYDQEKGYNCAHYKTIINPLTDDWTDALLTKGMLCKQFDNKETVNLSVTGKMAYIIETDLRDEDITKLYQLVYNDHSIHNRTEMNWTFVNELYVIPQIKQGAEAEVRIKVDENNILIAEIGPGLSKHVLREDIEKNYFYQVVFQPSINNN